MNISEFISRYQNHPILFIGTGFSLRYLKNSFTWDGLLSSISKELKGNGEFYLDVKSNCNFQYDKIAGVLDSEFTDVSKMERDGKFKEIHDKFYELMEQNINVSRMKLYIARLLSNIDIKENMQSELTELKKTTKNIGAIITTNYDQLIEHIFEFNPLIGNDILLSNPYGSVYKIHGCITDPTKIIITDIDYKEFNEKYELIRAQLLSLFIHNPIIFIGYSISDENIKSILKTIFTYVSPNSPEAEKIRSNFLLVEYGENSNNVETTEHDIDLEGYSTIRINKIKTDNFSAIYQAIADLTLPISAMDVRKVQSIVKEIYAGGTIKVHITEDLDSVKNGDRILAIGSSKTIKYEYQSTAEMMSNYFKIIDEANSPLLMLINKQKIQSNQYFPIFGFGKICPKIEKADALRQQQEAKIRETINHVTASCQTSHSSIDAINNDSAISLSNKINAIFWSCHEKLINIEQLEKYLRSYENKNDTNYRKLLCLFDLLKYGDHTETYSA